MDHESKSGMTKAEMAALMKQGFKEGAKEFMAEAAASFGWFSVKTIAAAALAALLYFILTMNGWQKGAH